MDGGKFAKPRLRRDKRAALFAGGRGEEKLRAQNDRQDSRGAGVRYARESRRFVARAL